MSHNNQNGKFFYFIISWLSLNVSAQFFFPDRIQNTLERRLLGLLGGVSQESDKVI